VTGPLLGVWAHPDDEAYLSAGLMAEARRQGRRVVVLTMTAGEHGTSDPTRWPPAELGARRRHELQASLAALGVGEHRIIGFPDGRCAEHDGVAIVAETIAALQPSTIVTFGPEGMTGHPDHRAVSAWTTAAWRASTGAAALLYATLTPSFHAAWGDLNDQVGLWADQPEPPATDHDDLALLVRLDGEHLDQKMAALRAHEMQTAPLIAEVGDATFRRWWAAEAFVAAA
jgi:LmbE family N-acetylglucosaminyl deacetylase